MPIVSQPNQMKAKILFKLAARKISVYTAAKIA
jgi:hypothetical protein